MTSVLKPMDTRIHVRMVRTVAICVIAFTLLFFFYQGRAHLHYQALVQGGQRVVATITQVEEMTGAKHPVYVLHYRYQVDGKEFTFDTHHNTGFTRLMNAYSDAFRRGEHPVKQGDTIPVFVDPADPTGHAVDRTAIPDDWVNHLFALLMGAFLVAVSGAATWAGWPRVRPGIAPPPCLPRG